MRNVGASCRNTTPSGFGPPGREERCYVVSVGTVCPPIQTERTLLSMLRVLMDTHRNSHDTVIVRVGRATMRRTGSWKMA